MCIILKELATVNEVFSVSEEYIPWTSKRRYFRIQ